MSLVDLLSSRALNLLTVCRVCERSYRVDRGRGDRGSFSVRFRAFSCRCVCVLRFVLVARMVLMFLRAWSSFVLT